MPRTKLHADNRKSNVIHIKLSPVSLMRLREAANREHLAVSTLARKYILERLNQK